MRAPTAPATRLARLAPLLLAAACRVGPPTAPPDLAPRTDPPWRAAAGPELTGEREALARWWERLESPELDALAARLVAENLSLAEARQRVAAAQARRGVVAGERAPQVSGELDVLKAGTGEQSLNFQGPPPGTEVELYSAGVAAAWELDLWGRIARQVEAADAELALALEDYRGIAVSLLAELALAYVDASSLRERLAVLERVIALQEETVRLARSRVEAGNGPRLDLEQAARELARSRARVPELQRALAGAENRVAVLVGARPSEDLIRAQDELALPPRVGRGLPADLLARRADVRRAERALVAALARVGVAEAERYPRLSLAGSVALRAQEPETLLDGADALSWSFGPSLVVPLFTGGRLEQEVRFREARAEEARLAYERALLEAIAEVETAGVALVRTRERAALLDEAAAAARAAAEMADELYQAGLRGLLQVVDAQRAQAAAEDERLLARQAALASAVDLYRALGGGWEGVTLEGGLALAEEGR